MNLGVSFAPIVPEYVVWTAFGVAALLAAMLLLVLADPRDMLLDWLQRGTFVRYRIESHAAIAAWLASVLEQLAGLVEGGFVPHALLRIDAVADDPQALAAAVGDAIGQPMEAGEITDKGYINQRAVLTRRADLVAFLHADVLDKTVISVHAAS